MEDIINEIKAKYHTGEFSQCIDGIKLSSNVIHEIVDSSLALFQNESFDRFLLTENMSILFDYYLKELERLFKSNNEEISFWAATLIVHHRILHNDAENLLLETIVEGGIEKAMVAATILTRNKKITAINAMKKRIISDKNMSATNLLFFNEKLQQIDGIG